MITPDDLVERVALRMCELAYSHIPNLDIAEQADDPYWREQARAAIAITLEEAERVAEIYEYDELEDDGGATIKPSAAIRAMINNGEK